MLQNTEVNTNVILPTAYLGSISYYAIMVNSSTCIMDYKEHFVKQSERSRCTIASANGRHMLTVPLLKRGKNVATKDIKISYDDDWRTIHWRTLEASYRSSPFFEFYEDELKPYFTTEKYIYLKDLNEALHTEICSMLGINPKLTYADEYHPQYDDALDYRIKRGGEVNAIDYPALEKKPYIQVFESKLGFLPNLSIFDLLFNQGPRAIDYLTL